MLSKKEVKDIQSLGHKKYRDESRCFIAEGPKIVNELINTIPTKIRKIFALNEWITNSSLKHNIEVIEINENELARLSQLQTPNQVIAQLEFINSIEPKDFDFVIYLDEVQDPGNFGTIIRIADWFGVKNIVCSNGCADMYNPKVIQATMASIARINIFYDTKEDWLSKQNKKIYAATLNGSSLFEKAYLNEGIFIVGNESQGIRDSFIKMAFEEVTIPKKGSAESLNAAVATGIILSHLIK